MTAGSKHVEKQSTSTEHVGGDDRQGPGVRLSKISGILCSNSHVLATCDIMFFSTCVHICFSKPAFAGTSASSKRLETGSPFFFFHLPKLTGNSRQFNSSKTLGEREFELLPKLTGNSRQFNSPKTLGVRVVFFPFHLPKLTGNSRQPNSPKHWGRGYSIVLMSAGWFAMISFSIPFFLFPSLAATYTFKFISVPTQCQELSRHPRPGLSSVRCVDHSSWPAYSFQQC
jgi:hypothetical protein